MLRVLSCAQTFPLHHTALKKSETMTTIQTQVRYWYPLISGYMCLFQSLVKIFIFYSMVTAMIIVIGMNPRRFQINIDKDFLNTAHTLQLHLFIFIFTLQ